MIHLAVIVHIREIAVPLGALERSPNLADDLVDAIRELIRGSSGLQWRTMELFNGCNVSFLTGSKRSMSLSDLYRGPQKVAHTLEAARLMGTSRARTSGIFILDEKRDVVSEHSTQEAQEESRPMCSVLQRRTPENDVTSEHRAPPDALSFRSSRNLESSPQRL